LLLWSLFIQAFSPLNSLKDTTFLYKVLSLGVKGDRQTGLDFSPIPSVIYFLDLYSLYLTLDFQISLQNLSDHLLKTHFPHMKTPRNFHYLSSLFSLHHGCFVLVSLNNLLPNSSIIMIILLNIPLTSLKYLTSSSPRNVGTKGAINFFFKTSSQLISLKKLWLFTSLAPLCPNLLSGSLANNLNIKSFKSLDIVPGISGFFYFKILNILSFQ